MTPLPYLILGAALIICLGAADPPPSQPGPRPEPDAHARVELRGTLQVAPPPGPDRMGQATGPSAVLVNAGTGFRLDFAGRPDLGRLAQSLRGQDVEVVGELATGPGPGASQAFLVRVHELGPIRVAVPSEDLIEGLRKAEEALVVYQPGRLDEANRLCNEIGLVVVRAYGRRSYLVCRWPRGCDLGRVVASLEDSRAIRYVVPNVKFRVSGGGIAAEEEDVDREAEEKWPRMGRR